MRDIKTLAPFNRLSAECHSALQQIATGRALRKGHALFVESNVADHVCVIVEGAVSVTHLHEDGREVTLEILGPGSMIGEIGLFGAMDRSASVEALDTTTFVAFPIPLFKGLMLQHAELALAVAEILAERLRLADERIQDYALLDARGRIRAVLHRIAHNVGQEHPDGSATIPLALRHSDIARLAGVARETTTKVLGGLIDEGALDIAHGRIVLAAGWRTALRS